MPWEPGKGIECHGRGQGHSLGFDAYQIIANMIQALGARTDEDLTRAGELLGIPKRQRGIDAQTIISHLTSINVKSVRSIRDGMRNSNYRVYGRVASGTMSSNNNELPNGTDCSSLPVVDTTTTATSSSELGDSEGQSDSDLDIGAASGAGEEDDNPSILDQWRRHPNYRIGMRIAQLSTFWITNGLPCDRFPLFLSWLRAQCPGLVWQYQQLFSFFG